jgi:cytochrome c peroxidase
MSIGTLKLYVVRFVLLALLSTGVMIAAPISDCYAQVINNERELGKELFSDNNLSVDRTVSCASCHQVNHAFADSRPVSIGVDGRHGTRNAPSLLDISEYTSFFWDGRATTLEEQVQLTVLSTVECGFSNPVQVTERVTQNASYVHAFQRLFKVSPGNLTVSDITRAIVAYERTLSAPPNALDRYLTGNQSAMSLAARRGMDVFRGKADCAGCHVISTRDAPLTDNRFHSSGVGLSAITPTLAKLASETARMTTAERFQKTASDSQIAALGRYIVTLNPQDIGKFRTPSLRNVALTRPYMHDGSVATLAQAVDIELYYRGLALGHPILLTSDEKQDLLAFLQSLSSVPQPTVATIQPGEGQSTLRIDTGAHARSGP